MKILKKSKNITMGYAMRDIIPFASFQSVSIVTFVSYAYLTGNPWALMGHVLSTIWYIVLSSAINNI